MANNCNNYAQHNYNCSVYNQIMFSLNIISINLLPSIFRASYRNLLNSISLLKMSANVIIFDKNSQLLKNDVVGEGKVDAVWKNFHKIAFKICFKIKSCGNCRVSH